MKPYKPYRTAYIYIVENKHSTVHKVIGREPSRTQKIQLGTYHNRGAAENARDEFIVKDIRPKLSHKGPKTRFASSKK